MNDEANPAPAEEQAPKVTKSIVPARYAGRYKGGGSSPTADFINTQCKDEKGLSFDKFFDLCSANGISDVEVNKYKSQVDAKVGGSAGRARMTLGNRLVAIARKHQKLVGLDGEEHEVAQPAAPTPAKEAA
jgi:hypothetical protein